jgi:hypothetical protein
MRFRRLDGDGPPLGDFEEEAHHRLVDAANLLHVERSVAEPFAVEDQEVLEHAEDDTITNIRNVELVFRPVERFPGASFKERVTVGIEEVSLAGRNSKIPMPAALVDHAKEG